MKIWKWLLTALAWVAFFMLFSQQDEYTNSIVFLLEKLFWWCGVIRYNNVLKHFSFKRLFTWFEVCWHCVLYRMLAVKNKLIVADPESQRLLHTTLWLLQVPACVWGCVCVCVRLKSGYCMEHLHEFPLLSFSQLAVKTVSLVQLQTSKPTPPLIVLLLYLWPCSQTKTATLILLDTYHREIPWSS